VRRQGLIREGPGRLARELPKSGSLTVNPLVELGRRASNVKAIEEVARIELRRAMPVAGSARLRQHRGVALQGVGADPHLFLTPDGHDVVSHGAPEISQRLSKGSSCMLGVGLGPEESQDRVPAAVSGGGRSKREIDEQSQALWLREQRLHLPALRVAEVDATERSELMHGTY
jgi:hypothetical protein